MCSTSQPEPSPHAPPPTAFTSETLTTHSWLALSPALFNALQQLAESTGLWAGILLKEAPELWSPPFMQVHLCTYRPHEGTDVAAKAYHEQE